MLEKTLESPLDCKEIKPVHPKGDQSWVFIGRTDVEAETPILWPPDAKSWLFGKDPDAGNDWGQEEKGTTEDEMVGWYHWLDAHGFGWTLGIGDGQGGLACCGSWGHKESDTIEWLNWAEVTGYQAEKDSNSWGIRNMWGELYHCPSLLSWEVFQATRRKGKQGRSQPTLNLRDKADSPGRPRQFEFSGQSNREEKVAKREDSKSLQRIPFELSTEYLRCVHVCEETVQSWGKLHVKGLEATVSSSHTGPEIVPILSSLTGNLKIQGHCSGSA